MKHFILLLRPHHWTKNLFLFIPIFFAGSLFEYSKFLWVLQGFFCFSLAASTIYILNDLGDIKTDRVHPVKKLRPLASGKIGNATAIGTIVILLPLSLIWAFYLNNEFAIILCIYLALNIAYTFGLKNIPILDLFIVSSGFLFRVISGGFLGSVPVSHWLIIMVLLLALFLTLAKRRDDLIQMVKDGTPVRQSSSGYNLDFINACLTMLSAVVIVAYIMYTVSDEVTERFNTEYLFLTCVFVIAGIMRYLQITIVEKDSGSPTRILISDRFTFLVVIGWIFSFFIIIY